MDQEPWASTELSFAAPPHVRLSLRETGDGGIHVTGTVDAVVELPCRRCLEEVDVELQLQVDWLFEPEVVEDAEEEGMFTLDPEEGVLDLTPRVREEILLEAPAYPICREGCRGLCPKCGTNLNRDSCSCETSEPDPRWGPLRDLASS